MELAAEEGLEPAAFWRLTPREFNAFMRGRAQAARSRHAEAVTTAWHVAAFGRTPPKKKLPDLARIVRKILKIKAREQTPEEALRLVERLNMMMGGRDLRHMTPRKPRGS